MLSRDDPRKMLELHHKQHHKNRGENTIENLETLCNVHHDQRHRKTRLANTEKTAYNGKGVAEVTPFRS
jgi:5-methylcytosine-specific restriction endonuclease McrA